MSQKKDQVTQLVLCWALTLLSGALEVPQVSAHHYKGLPHYNYFENYPQIPYLEFIKETPEYEVFVTVYNFQGLNLDLVESPDDVRFYIYIYDLVRDRISKQSARFRIRSHGELVHVTDTIPPEQENIFVIQKKIEKQDNLTLEIEFRDVEGRMVQITMPFQITETFFQKYGLYLSIAFFFILVATLKVLIVRFKGDQTKTREVMGVS